MISSIQKNVPSTNFKHQTQNQNPKGHTIMTENYTARVAKLLNDVSGPNGTPADSTLAEKEDERWNGWYGFRERKPGPAELGALLRSEIYHAQKARALVVLLAPSFKLIPFKWGVHESPKRKGYPFLKILVVNALPEVLLEFTGKLACLGMDHAKKEKMDEKMREFQCLMIDLLPLLPRECRTSSEIQARLH